MTLSQNIYNLDWRTDVCIRPLTNRNLEHNLFIRQILSTYCVHREGMGENGVVYKAEH